MMHFTVEEENLICMYHNADRRRTIGKITAAMPGMDGDMWTLAQQTLSKLKRMTDSDYDSQKFYFTDENSRRRARRPCGRLRPASFLFACSYAFRTQY